MSFAGLLDVAVYETAQNSKCLALVAICHHVANLKFTGRVGG